MKFFLKHKSKTFSFISLALGFSVFKTIRKPEQISDLDNQLQLSIGASKALPFIKMADKQAMMGLFATQKQLDFSQYKNPQTPLTFTDLGGGDGQMIEPFLEKGIYILVNFNEPHKKSFQHYLERINKDSHLNLGLASELETEDPAFTIPKSDVILASHSLYYNSSLWKKTFVTTSNHFLTKIISSLKKDGLLCVILQSGDSSLSPNQLAIHEDLEDVTYPFIDRSRGDIPVRGRERVNFTNAEEFEKTIKLYSDKLNQEHGISMKIDSSISIATIKLGDVKFTPDPVTGKYQQTPAVENLFMFYTRDRYNYFSVSDQQQFLGFLKQRCQLPNGEFVVTHVNKVFLISQDDQETEEKVVSLPVPW